MVASYMQRWQPGWMGILKVFFFSGGSIGCVRGLRQRVGFAEKRVWSWNMWANVLERVTRITKNDGDIEPTKLTGSF